MKLKKILSCIIVISLIFSFTGCSKEVANKKVLSDYKIPEGCMASNLTLTFEDNISHQEGINKAVSTFIDYSESINLYAYVTTDNNIIAYNSSAYEDTSNPYEELSYTINEIQKELKYRYICYDDVTLFDETYVINQIQKIFGYDLSKENFAKTVREFKEIAKDIENDTIIPATLEIGSNVDFKLAIMKKDNRQIISVVMAIGETSTTK